MRRAIAAVSLVLLLVPGLAARSSGLDSKIDRQRQKTQEIARRLNQKRGELHAAALRVTDLQAALDHTNGEIAGVNARLGDLQAQQNSTELKLAWNTTQLDAARRTLRRHDDALKRRLVDAYEHGDMSYVSVLLASSSFSDFVERWNDVRLLIAANQREIRERKAAEAKVAAAQSSLLRTQQMLQSQALAQQEARNQLGVLAQERSNLVAVAAEQRRAVAGQVATLEDLSAAQEAQLEAMIVERQRELEAQRAAARRAAGIAGPESAPGALDWPVTGTITSPFGMRPNPFGGGPEFHTGLDIAAPMGTVVKAAVSGTVISAGWYGGYGNFILIDHGGGMATAYGHLSQILVADGQHVDQGVVIGLVGSTGASTGPHLHFEVRISGKPVDPTAYLH